MHCALQCQIGTHFFGHAYLSSLLLPTLKQSAPSRIVWTTSAAEAAGDVDWDNLAYVLNCPLTVFLRFLPFCSVDCLCYMFRSKYVLRAPDIFCICYAVHAKCPVVLHSATKHTAGPTSGVRPSHADPTACVITGYSQNGITYHQMLNTRVHAMQHRYVIRYRRTAKTYCTSSCHLWLVTVIDNTSLSA